MRRSRLHELGILLSYLTLACGSTSPQPRASDPPSRASEPRRAKKTPANVCDRGGTPERVEVLVGKTAIARSGVAVTFRGALHDNFGNDRTDLIVHLIFQGVLDDGSLTPSALTWMPSAFAKPEWTHLAVNRCARVIEADESRVVLELFKPSD